MDYFNVGITQLPDTYSLIPYLPPIQEKHLRGMCVAETIATIIDFKQYKREHNRNYGHPFSIYNDRMSPWYIHNQRKGRYSSDPKKRKGMYPKDALEIVRQNGICPERIHGPYHDIITEKIRNYAKKVRISEYYQIRSMNEMKRSIFRYGPCLISFRIYNTDTSFPWIKRDRDKYLSGHSMAVVGWNKDSFIVRNTWGNKWQNNGYCHYPFSQWGLHKSIWVIKR